MQAGTDGGENIQQPVLVIRPRPVLHRLLVGRQPIRHPLLARRERRRFPQLLRRDPPRPPLQDEHLLLPGRQLRGRNRPAETAPHDDRVEINIAPSPAPHPAKQTRPAPRLASRPPWHYRLLQSTPGTRQSRLPNPARQPDLVGDRAYPSLSITLPRICQMARITTQDARAA